MSNLKSSFLYGLYRKARWFLTQDSGFPEVVECSSRKFIYLVNSKCACTSIKRLLAEDMYGEIDWSGYYNVHQFWNDKPERRFGKQFVDEGVWSFTIVRDPVERIYSLYKNKFEDKDKIEREGFYFKNYPFGSFQQDMTFEEFVVQVCKIPDILADRHFVSQTYLINKSGISLDFTGKLEEIDYVWDKFVKPATGLDMLTTDNRSGNKKVVNRDPRLVAMLRKRYASDIRELGY